MHDHARYHALDPGRYHHCHPTRLTLELDLDLEACRHPHLAFQGGKTPTSPLNLVDGDGTNLTYG